jgi:ABC-type glutathione transport system ATPase component
MTQTEPKPQAGVRPTPAAALRGVTVVYRRGATKVEAVSDVTLELPRGRLTGLIGESGAGKSTVINVLLGIVAPRHGVVEINGTDVASVSRKRAASLRNDIQVVMQDPYRSLDPRWTVQQCIAEPMRAAARRAGQRTSTAALRPRIAEMLDRVRLPQSKLTNLPRQLSGGERQRVAVARALSVSPSTLVADEPVTALDNETTQQIVALLAELHQSTDIAILLVAHSMSFVAQLAEYVHVMAGGRIIESGDTETILSRPTHEYSRTLVEASRYLDDYRVGTSGGHP